MRYHIGFAAHVAVTAAYLITAAGLAYCTYAALPHASTTFLIAFGGLPTALCLALATASVCATRDYMRHAPRSRLRDITITSIR